MEEPRPARPRTGPRYQPRAFLINSQEFGRTRLAAFVEETPENKVQRAGSLAQHLLVERIRAALSPRNLSIIDLAELSGVKYQRLARLMRGAAPMYLEDIGLIANVVPEAFDFLLGDADGRFIPAAMGRHMHFLEQVRAALQEYDAGGKTETAPADSREHDPDSIFTRTPPHPAKEQAVRAGQNRKEVETRRRTR